MYHKNWKKITKFNPDRKSAIKLPIHEFMAVSFILDFEQDGETVFEERWFLHDKTLGKMVDDNNGAGYSSLIELESAHPELLKKKDLFGGKKNEKFII